MYLSILTRWLALSLFASPSGRDAIDFWLFIFSSNEVVNLCDFTQKTTPLRNISRTPAEVGKMIFFLFVNLTLKYLEISQKSLELRRDPFQRRYMVFQFHIEYFFERDVKTCSYSQIVLTRSTETSNSAPHYASLLVSNNLETIQHSGRMATLKIAASAF